MSAHARTETIRTLLEHQRRFLAFLIPRVGSEDAAREVLQAALVKALERGGDLQDQERAVAWFYRLLRNALVDRARRATVEARALASSAAEAVLDEASASALERHVCACVATLTSAVKPEYAEILKAVELGDAPLTDYARGAGISPGNARVRLHRARNAIARRLLEACGVCCADDCGDCPCEA